MRIKVLKTEKDHKAALEAIETLWNAKAGTPKGDDLELLAALVETYEDKKHTILPPDPIAAIKFRMEQQGLTNTDLAKIVGGKNRASEILSRKRRLTVEMMRQLNRKFHIPAESLLAA